jgi:methyl-accepting chemotaxis protein
MSGVAQATSQTAAAISGARDTAHELAGMSRELRTLVAGYRT